MISFFIGLKHRTELSIDFCHMRVSELVWVAERQRLEINACQGLDLDGDLKRLIETRP